MSEVSQVSRRAFLKATGIAIGFLTISLIALISAWQFWPHSLICSIDRLFFDFVILRGDSAASTMGIAAVVIIKAIQTSVLFLFIFRALNRDKPSYLLVLFVLLLFILLIIPLGRIPAL